MSDLEQESQPAAAVKPRFQFSLGTLLLLVTLFSVWMGLLITVPCIAVAALVFFCPALARAMFIMQLLKSHGEATSSLEKLSMIVASMVLVIFVYLMTLAAAMSSILVGGLLYLAANFISGGRLTNSVWESCAFIGVSIVTMLITVFVAAWLMWKSWPRYSEALRYEYF